MKTFCLLFFLCLFLQYPIAQSQETPSKKKEQDSLKYELSPVTIISTRYPEEILEIPYAVTIIFKKQLENIKGYGLDEVLNSIPGVFTQSRAGNQDVRLVIRGFGARGAGDRSNSGTSRGLRIMVDGFPETEPDGRTSFDNIDLSLADNIEVVRSNASALWGNASGGIVNINTIPYFENYFIKSQMSAGYFGFRKAVLQMGTTIGNGKIYSSFSISSFNGWRNHSASNRSIFNLNLISNLSNNTKLTTFLTATSNIFHIPGPLTNKQYESDPKQANPSYEKRDERRYNRLGRIGISFEHNIDVNNHISGMAFIMPKYLQRSERGTYRDFTRYYVGGNVIYRNNFNIFDKISNIFCIGIDEAYQDGVILFYSLSSSNGRGDNLTTNKREGANNFGAFIQNEIIFGNKFSMIGGLRLDNVSYYNEDFLSPKLGLQQKTFSKLTPKAGITYRITPYHSIYANIGGGLEVPAGNETDPAGTYNQDTVYLINPLLDPISTVTFEMGSKQVLNFEDDFIMNQLSYDLALYFINIKNDIIPYKGGRFYFTAGKTNRLGIEFGLNILFKNALSLQSAITYSKNKYREYTIDSVHYGNPGKSADYRNMKVAGIPDFFYNTQIGFAPDFLLGTFIKINLNGIGKYYADDANRIEVPSYTTFDLSIGTSEEIRLTNLIGIKGFISINNIFNRKYVASSFINPDVVNGEPVYLEPGLPGNITFSLSVNFQ